MQAILELLLKTIQEFRQVNYEISDFPKFTSLFPDWRTSAKYYISTFALEF